MGCAVASLSMVTGHPYQQVKQYFGRSFEDGGMSFYDSDQYLADHGYGLARKWRWFNRRERSPWPPEPFGDVHLCEVQSVVGSHMVVMLDSGLVLDPATPLVQRLTDYWQVNSVAAVFRLRAVG